MRRRSLLLVVLLLTGLLAGSALGLGASKVFDRPITIVCPYGAGGGTDLTNRALAEGMKEYLGVQVNVINMVGGSGGVGADYVWQKPHDGYTILGCSETNLFLPANGGHFTTAKDWEYFMAGGSPGVAMVKPDSAFKSFADVIKASKDKPGSVKVAASVAGGMWHTKWSLICKAAGIQTNILGYTGSAPSITAGMTGEVDIVHVSVAEALSYMQAKQLRPLCVTELEAYEIPGVGKTPAVVEFIPEAKKVLPMPQWLGICVPADTSKAALAELTEAFKSAMKSEHVKKFLDPSKAYVTYGYYGAKSKEIAQSLESKFCWALFELGAAKKSPAEMGIPKP